MEVNYELMKKYIFGFCCFLLSFFSLSDDVDYAALISSPIDVTTITLVYRYVCAPCAQSPLFPFRIRKVNNFFIHVVADEKYFLRRC